MLRGGQRPVSQSSANFRCVYGRVRRKIANSDEIRQRPFIHFDTDEAQRALKFEAVVVVLGVARGRYHLRGLFFDAFGQ